MTTTYTSYSQITRDLPRSIERIASQPEIARESEYYLTRISEIKSIDEFMADTRVFNYAMKAHGLEDMNYAKAFMRKVLSRGASRTGFLRQQAGRFQSTRNLRRKPTNFGHPLEPPPVFTKAQAG